LTEVRWICTLVAAPLRSASVSGPAVGFQTFQVPGCAAAAPNVALGTGVNVPTSMLKLCAVAEAVSAKQTPAARSG
jgi:hypothetical protein